MKKKCYKEKFEKESETLIAYIDQLSADFIKKLPISNPATEIAVIIPAKNEVENMEHTLQSLLLQKDDVGQFFKKNKFEVFVLAHNCTDQTFAVCSDFFKKHPSLNGFVFSLNSELANTVGAARRLLMNMACERLHSPEDFIVSTDADTIPEEQWLYQISRFRKSKIDLVCGQIETYHEELSGQALHYQLLKEEYITLKSRLEDAIFHQNHDPWPKHGYHWGPNLSVKKKVYQAIGGMKPLHFLEDVDFYQRSIAAGFLAKHSLRIKVFTSARTDSRCSEGFGAELQVWKNNDGIPYRVESYKKLCSRFEMYARIREYFQKPSKSIRDKISTSGKIPIEDLHPILNQTHFAAAVISLEKYLNQHQAWNLQYPDVQVETACEELRNHFKESAAYPENSSKIGEIKKYSNDSKKGCSKKGVRINPSGSSSINGVVWD